jgi:hypothetical protein
VRDFAKHTAAEADTAEWNIWPGVGVGLLASNHPAVDIDCPDPALDELVRKLTLAMLGPAPVRTGNAPKRLLLYRG